MKKKLLLILILCAFSIFPLCASAASMYLTLNKDQVSENGTFQGTAYVSSDTNINNAEGTLSFPTNLLSVDSIDTGNSIFNIWIEKPTYSNTSGTISFNGGLPSPGYSGSAGTIFKVNFRAKAAGLASLDFRSNAVRANDGKGTDVLTNSSGASLIVVGPIAPKPIDDTAPTPVDTAVPKAPTIASKDMPNQDGWYNTTEGTFSWKVPSDVIAVRLVLSRSPDALPVVYYETPITTKTLTDIPEGTLYLNAQFQNVSGWGAVASRKIQIDTVDPLDLEVTPTIDEDGQLSIAASARDVLSGIERYEVYEGTQKLGATSTTDDASQFGLAPLTAGTHNLTLRAYDKAGNYAEKTFSVSVPETPEPMSPAAEPAGFGMSVLTTQFMIVALIILISLFVLLILIYIELRKLNSLKRKLRSDLTHTKEEARKVFKTLRGNTSQHLKVLNELSKDLDETEKYLSEQVKNVEKGDK